MRYSLFYGFVCGVFVVIGSIDVAESLEVKKPKVHEGEVEVEYHGASFAENPEDAEEKLRHTHEIEVSAGFASFWKLGVAGELEKSAGDDFDLAEVELINTFVLKRDTGDGLALGLFAAIGTEIGDPASAIEVGPIVQFRSGRFTLLTNTFLPYSFNTEEGDFFSFEYATQAKYDFSHQFGIGIEAYGEVEDLGDAAPFDQQEHRLGPVIYWSLGHDHLGVPAEHHGLKDEGAVGAETLHMSAAFGVLFGATDVTNDVTLKWDLEVEF